MCTIGRTRRASSLLAGLTLAAFTSCGDAEASEERGAAADSSRLDGIRRATVPPVRKPVRFDTQEADSIPT